MEESAQETLQHNPILTPELQRALSAAVQTASGFCSAASHCAQRLGEIEEQIEEASTIDGVRVLRFRLLESLQGMREETHHRRRRWPLVYGRIHRRRHRGNKIALRLYFFKNPANPFLASSVVRESAFICTPASIAFSSVMPSVWYKRLFISVSAEDDFSTSPSR